MDDDRSNWADAAKTAADALMLGAPMIMPMGDGLPASTPVDDLAPEYSSVLHLDENPLDAPLDYAAVAGEMAAEEAQAELGELVDQASTHLEKQLQDSADRTSELIDQPFEEPIALIEPMPEPIDAPFEMIDPGFDEPDGGFDAPGGLF